MADKQVSVTLQGRDNLSPVFQKVGQSAQQAGRTIEQAGQSVKTFDKNATTAEQSMSRFERAVTKAQTASSKLGISAQTAGAAIGTAVTAGLLLSVKAAADAEVSQQRLQTSIEATGALFEQYAGQVAAVNNQALSLSFDDEDAQDALSALVQATNDVDLSLSQMGLAMDIARGRGIDLASATKIVIAADQERFTALKRLGIQIDENATKESVLADLQAKYAGQAQAYAETNAGAFDRWQNSAENAAEAVGAFLGPAQQLLLVFPGLAAGATAAASAMTALGGTTAALGALAGVLLGPVGVAAGFAAVALMMEKFGKKGDGLTSEEVWANTAEGAEHLDTVLAALAATGANDLYTLGNASNKTLDQMYGDFQRWQALSQSVDAGTTMEDFGISAEEAQGQMQDFLDTYGSASAAAADFASAQNDVAMILADTGIGAEIAQDKLATLLERFQSGEIDADRFLREVHNVALNLGYYDVQAMKAAEANKTLSDSFQALNAIVENNWNQTSVEAARVAANQEEAQRRVNAQLEIAATNYNHMSVEAARAAQTAEASGQRQLAAFASHAGQMSVEAARASSQMSPGEVQFIIDQQKLESNKQKIADATEDMTRSFNAVQSAVTGTTQALESGFRVAISNTNAMGDAAQAVQDWADELIGAQGTYAQIDDLLQRGTITQQQYNDAQAAYTPIAEANARIQDDILAIQTAQAPVQAELMQQQADYLDTVKAMNPEMQAFTLAMMDSATASEALGLATSLLGENGDVFAPMVEAAANLDPYLATILERMGLIEEQPDGTWTVTLDDQASSPMQDLKAAMDDLNETVATLITYLDDDPFNDGVTAVKAQMADLDDETAFPQVSLIDGASSGLQSIAGLLASLDGRTATTYVQTVNQTIQQTLNPFESGGTVAYANGGTSPYGYSREAKNGLTATLVGERGPEVLMLPGGAQVMNTEGSRSRWGGGAPSLHIEIHGNVYGLADLEDKMADSISRAWVRANQMHERSMGR